jgi:hypothetical protein
MSKKRTSTTPKLTKEDELHADNALAALNLEMNYGAIIHTADNMPPEILHLFLANVKSFEDENRQENQAMTTVFERIGSPAFATPDLLEKTTLPIEIERLLTILEDNGIVPLRPNGVTDEDYYHFLIYDIFPHKVAANRIGEMMFCLDYLDFHPNTDQKEVIPKLLSTFLLSLLYLNKPFEVELLAMVCRNDLDKITRKQALQSINAFREQYLEFQPIGYRPEELFDSEHGIHQMFSVCYEGMRKDTGEKVRHEGLGVAQFIFKENEWWVQGVSMPGFKF